MRVDYLDAHERHWHDADSLFLAQRWANADHLYGMAAECGLKRLMLALGMPYDDLEDSPAEQRDRQHADGIWVRYEIYRGGRQDGTSYALPRENPFADWSAAQRYAHQIHFNQSRATNHRKGAQQVRALLKKAQWDGWLR